MIDLARQGWRWVIVQGALTLLFGLAIGMWPQSTRNLLLIVLVLSGIGGGLASMILMLREKENIVAAVGLGLLGIACLVLGITSLIWPEVATIGLIVFIVLEALAAATFLIMVGISVRQTNGGGLLAIISGIIAFLIVPAVLIWGAGATTGSGQLIGAYATLEGVILIVAGALLPRELPGAPQPRAATR